MNTEKKVIPRTDKTRINLNISKSLKLQVKEYAIKHSLNSTDAIAELLRLGLAYVSLTEFLNNTVKKFEEKSPTDIE